MRLGAVILMACLVTAVACGGGHSGASNSPLTGNWEINLQAHGLPEAEPYTGFLIQNGSSISGSVILGAGCSGVGSVTGTVDGQNLTLNVDEFGQDLSLIGTVPAGSTAMSGQFSTLTGGCTAPYSSTGTWTAVLVAPINGTFTGTLSSTVTGGTEVNLSGTLTQGPNIGASTATLSGTMTATNPASSFCTYLTAANMTGVISGETAALSLFGPDGLLISQIPASIAPDGSSLSGTYIFQNISNGCPGDSGTVKLAFQ